MPHLSHISQLVVAWFILMSYCWSSFIFLECKFSLTSSYWIIALTSCNRHAGIFWYINLILQDEVLIEGPIFEEFWHRDVEESVRQGTAKPFIEEAVLQVSNWGFSLADLQVRKECQRRGILAWLRSIYSQEQCELTGFLGPIHIWQVCTHSLSCFIIFCYTEFQLLLI